MADAALPQPRLVPQQGADVIEVPAFTDFKLRDITDPADKDAVEPLDMNYPTSSPKFLGGNRRFLTKRLWAAGNQATYFHHGLFTTLREAVLAHAGEALAERLAFQRLDRSGQEPILAFLQSLQVLPPGTSARIVNGTTPLP